MRKPKMILFDYGQTLICEQGYDILKGIQALLQYAVGNKHNYTDEYILKKWEELYAELGEFDDKRRFEVPNRLFVTYLFESLGITLSCTPQDIDRIFWYAATPSVPTEGIGEFLDFLKTQDIRTGVISNIAYGGDVLAERIEGFLPDHNFEFIIATSEYMFKKPNRRIFTLALEKAGLPPEDVWYIGNSYRCDVNGARNAGIFPVWYIGATPNPQGEKDVLTVSHWNKLKEILEKI